jgi:hypothetical protein
MVSLPRDDQERAAWVSARPDPIAQTIVVVVSKRRTEHQAAPPQDCKENRVLVDREGPHAPEEVRGPIRPESGSRRPSGRKSDGPYRYPSDFLIRVRAPIP